LTIVGAWFGVNELARRIRKEDDDPAGRATIAEWRVLRRGDE
jgi:hypothetical protein